MMVVRVRLVSSVLTNPWQLQGVTSLYIMKFWQLINCILCSLGLHTHQDQLFLLLLHPPEAHLSSKDWHSSQINLSGTIDGVICSGIYGRKLSVGS